jgi:membrane protease YdiL (CAAX protease family)
MHAIGVSSWIFLCYLLVLLPAIAIRSARVFNAPADDPARRAIPPLMRIYQTTIVLLLLLFALAWFTARTFGYPLFAIPQLGARELIAGAGALLLQFGMLFASQAARTGEERRSMPVNRMMPQSQRERALFSVVAVVAGISEEAAYRGVLMSVLWYGLGNPWLAVLISALAFAVGHALQGWKSMIVVFAMACSMHALVWYTGTLVIAMAVHAIYDLLAPTIRRRILRVPPTGQERIAG